MPFYQKGDARIHYQEAGSGYPLLVLPGGGLNASISCARCARFLKAHRPTA